MDKTLTAIPVDECKRRNYCRTMKLVDTRAHNINHPEVVALRANVIVIVVVQNKAGQSCFDVISSTIKFKEITVLALLLTVKTLHVIHTI